MHENKKKFGPNVFIWSDRQWSIIHIFHEVPRFLTTPRAQAKLGLALTLLCNKLFYGRTMWMPSFLFLIEHPFILFSESCFLQVRFFNCNKFRQEASLSNKFEWIRLNVSQQISNTYLLLSLSIMLVVLARSFLKYNYSSSNILPIWSNLKRTWEFEKLLQKGISTHYEHALMLLGCSWHLKCMGAVW